MQERREAHVSAVAALGEPTRRRLYDHVVHQTADVSRDDVAAALGLPRSTVAFHLDRLVDEHLLDVVHERRSGRTGPGAGRPAKLYRRSARDVAVSLPERRYDLAGLLLADAVEEADRTGRSPRAVLGRRAHELGAELAASAAAAAGGGSPRDLALRTLETVGYEPRADGAGVVLGNCPFHALAQRHTELVCGMNQRLVEGLLSGLPRSGLTTRLRPAPGHCCVRLSAAPTG